MMSKYSHKTVGIPTTFEELQIDRLNALINEVICINLLHKSGMNFEYLLEGEIKR
jgi:hypothetical protein